MYMYIYKVEGVDEACCETGPVGPHRAAPAGSWIALWHCCDIKKSRVSLDHPQNLEHSAELNHF